MGETPDPWQEGPCTSVYSSSLIVLKCNSIYTNNQEQVNMCWGINWSLVEDYLEEQDEKARKAEEEKRGENKENSGHTSTEQS